MLRYFVGFLIRRLWGFHGKVFCGVSIIRRLWEVSMIKAI